MVNVRLVARAKAVVDDAVFSPYLPSALATKQSVIRIYSDMLRFRGNTRGIFWSINHLMGHMPYNFYHEEMEVFGLEFRPSVLHR